MTILYSSYIISHRCNRHIIFINALFYFQGFNEFDKYLIWICGHVTIIKTADLVKRTTKKLMSDKLCLVKLYH